MDDDKILTMDEFAKEMQMSKYTLQRRENWEKFGGRKINGIIRFTMRWYKEATKKND